MPTADSILRALLPGGPAAEAAIKARTGNRLKPGKRTHRGSPTKQAYRNARRQEAANAILDALPASGEVLHLVLDGQFNLGHLVPRILDLAGEPAEALDLATLGFNDATVAMICKLTEAGKIGKVRILASHYFRSVDGDLWHRSHKALTDLGHSVFMAKNHAKMQLYRFKSGRVLTLLSSANLRTCNSAELAVLFSDQATFDFWHGVIEELLTEAKDAAN